MIVILVVAAAGMSVPLNVNLSCPPGTRATSGGACVLDADVVLSNTLELPAYTTLDCRGHRILPIALGSGTTQESYVPSMPPLAIAITGESGVVVRNCTIGVDGQRFDFGVIAFNSKDAGKDGHRIHNNEIHARDSAITFLRVDDARVNNNVITWTNGSGILLTRDSDRNRVNNNAMSSPGVPPAAYRLVPGGTFGGTLDDAIFISSLPLIPLLNLVINGRLYQFPNSEDGQYSGMDDNFVGSNHLSLPGSSTSKSHVGILVAGNAFRTRVIDNTVAGGGTGIRLAGLMPAQPVTRPVRCSQDSTRFCLTNADCFIPGVDLAPAGTCPLPTTEVRDLRGNDSVVSDNRLYGPFNATSVPMRTAIFGGAGSVSAVIRGNLIHGTGIEAGITLLGETLQSGMVSDNVVQGASVGILLQQGDAITFEARVFRNNITDSTTRAVGVAGTYTLPTELSWKGVGNYWGHLLPPCFRSSDTPIPGLIQDSYPFCLPIAAPK